MKLSPKPQPSNELMGWKELDDLLKSSFDFFRFDSATIEIKDFYLTKEEIILEGKKSGYNVVEKTPGYLHFS